jgi:hypothetical protein
MGKEKSKFYLFCNDCVWNRNFFVMSIDEYLWNRNFIFFVMIVYGIEIFCNEY